MKRIMLGILTLFASHTFAQGVMILPSQSSLGQNFGQSFAQGFQQGLNNYYSNNAYTYKKQNKVSYTDLYGNTTTIDLETGQVSNQYGIQGYIK